MTFFKKTGFFSTRRNLSLVGFAVFAVLLVTSAELRAGDFIDTRITFVISDDNLLAGSGETKTNSPNLDFGPREGNFFPFENLDKRDSGDETLSHLVLHKRLGGFIPRLITEAAVVIRTQLINNGDVKFSDDGSYINVIVDLGEALVDPDSTEMPSQSIALTFYPYTSERFRLGYSYDLSWGGQGIFADIKDRPVPALKLTYNDESWYAFFGAKTTQQLNAEEDTTDDAHNELAAFWGVLGGVGFDITNWFNLEVNGGFFQSGKNRKSGIEGLPVQSGGISTQLTFHDGIDIGPSVDFRLYRNDQSAFGAFLWTTPEKAETFAWKLSVEFSYLTQTLGNPNVYGETTNQPAMAGDINFYSKIGFLTLRADIVYRDLAFILFNVPGLDPFNSFPEGSEQSPEFMGAISADYYMESLRLTPSFLFGIQNPATYRGTVPSGTNPSDFQAGRQTMVIRNRDSFEILPQGEESLPVISAKLGLRWDISPMLSVLGEVSFSFDQNQVKFTDDEFGIGKREFRDPSILGLAFLIQGRW